MSAVFLVRRHYEILGHVGRKMVTDYDVYLGAMRLRGFSTHGNMQEGYWGHTAKPNAEAYAEEVAKAAGLKVYRALHKQSLPDTWAKCS